MFAPRRKQKIYYYNADEERLPIIDAIEAAATAAGAADLVRLDDGMSIRWFRDIRDAIFIFHRSPLAGGLDDERDLFRELLDPREPLTPGSVIIRVSTCPLQNIQTRINFEDRSEKRYLLYLPDTVSAGLVGNGSEARWTRLLEALSEQEIIDSFLNGDGYPAEDPESQGAMLRRILKPLSSGLLAELRLLCLGFLLCHGQGSSPIDADAHSGRLGALPPSADPARSLEERREQTEQSQWWIKVLQRNGRLGQIHNLRKKTPEAVERLISHLLTRDRIHRTEIVANAYDAFRREGSPTHLDPTSLRVDIVHQWLANRYLNRISAMKIRIAGGQCAQERIRSFIENDLLTWQIESPKLRTIITAVENDTSPRLLIERGPPILRTEDYRWLAPIIHDFWLAKRQIAEYSNRCLEALAQADEIHRDVLVSVGRRENETVHLDAQALSSLQSSCEKLVRCFEALPSRVELP